MFNALVDFDSKTPKEKLLALLDIAEVILEHDARIDGFTLDDCELEDAGAEDAFEEVRTHLHKAVEAVDYYVD